MECPICGDATVIVSRRRVVHEHGIRSRVFNEDEETCKNCGWSESDGVPADLDIDSEDSSDGRAEENAIPPIDE